MMSNMNHAITNTHKFGKMLGDDYGVNIAISNDLCDFEILDENEDHNLPNIDASNFDQILLNKDMPSTTVSHDAECEQDEEFANHEPREAQIHDAATSEQRQVFPSSTAQGTRGVWSPLSHDGLCINNNPASPFHRSPHTQAVRPQSLLRPNSLLRNQYNPWLLDPSPSHNNTYPPLDTYEGLLLNANLASYNASQLQYNSRASTMVHQARQPFEESNVRSPLTPNFNMLHQPKSHHHTHYPDPPSFSPDTQYRSPHTEFNTPALPHTPPNISHVSHLHHTPTTSACSLNSVQRDASSPASPRSQVKREQSASKRCHAAMQTDPSFDNVQLPRIRVPQEDRVLLEGLIAAMIDGSDAEDNLGMIKTWDKLRLAKADRLRAKAREMLELVRRAEREEISEKKAVHQYQSFEHRYDELCKALKTQKTICKHLMEEEYSSIVANDPTYAAQRVKNNRRVNDQKKIAIEVGRELMGEKGRGKGRKVEKVPSVIYVEEDEESGLEGMSDEDSDAHYDNKSHLRSRKKAKKSRRSSFNDDDDDDDGYSDFTVKTPSTTKRSKRHTHSTTKPTHNGNTRSYSKPHRATRNTHHTVNHNDPQVMDGSPIKHRPHHIQDQYNAYNYNDYPHHPYAPSLNHGLPSMVPELPRGMFGLSNGYQHHDQHTTYSSGTDPTYASDYHGPEAPDTNGYGDPAYSEDLFGPSAH